MNVQENRTVTFTLTAAEARDYWTEVSEMEGLLRAGPDQGNTRTGLAVLRAIRDQIGALGLGVTPVPYEPPAVTAQVVGAAQGYAPPQSQQYYPPQPPYPQQPVSPPQPPWVAR